ncbi:NAD(P)/FAD-dependent oxidoreductase, partial [Nocardia cyriacigeorgica]|nr:NAD(P)/FAD-dependent oxidoreductase [Nocardia cyriacigeorgica]
LGLSNFVILEREDDLGGTWHVNRYPGLAVDIASVTYSYSFEPNPYWSRLFAPGAELKKYAEHVADKYGLRRRMRFGTVVDGARWDEEEQQWVVS